MSPGFMTEWNQNLTQSKKINYAPTNGRYLAGRVWLFVCFYSFSFFSETFSNTNRGCSSMTSAYCATFWPPTPASLLSAKITVTEELPPTRPSLTLHLNKDMEDIMTTQYNLYLHQCPLHNSTQPTEKCECARRKC